MIVLLSERHVFCIKAKLRSSCVRALTANHDRVDESKCKCIPDVDSVWLSLTFIWNVAGDVKPSVKPKLNAPIAAMTAAKTEGQTLGGEGIGDCGAIARETGRASLPSAVCNSGADSLNGCLCAIFTTSAQQVYNQVQPFRSGEKKTTAQQGSCRCLDQRVVDGHSFSPPLDLQICCPEKGACDQRGERVTASLCA